MSRASSGQRLQLLPFSTAEKRSSSVLHSSPITLIAAAFGRVVLTAPVCSSLVENKGGEVFAFHIPAGAALFYTDIVRAYVLNLKHQP